MGGAQASPDDPMQSTNDFLTLIRLHDILSTCGGLTLDQRRACFEQGVADFHGRIQADAYSAAVAALRSTFRPQEAPDDRDAPEGEEEGRETRRAGRRRPKAP